MTREHLTAQIRRIRAAENRDPVENAAFALCALTCDQLAEAAERFNAIFDKLPQVPVIRLAAKNGGGARATHETPHCAEILRTAELAMGSRARIMDDWEFQRRMGWHAYWTPDRAVRRAASAVRNLVWC